MDSVDNSVVYVVDDDLEVRLSLKSLMESVGLSCEVFSSPAEFKLAQSSEEKVSCLILEMRLPELAGFTLQTELARAQPHLPIIGMTAHADIRIPVKAMKGGAVDFFAKPYRDQYVVEAVQAALARAHSSRLVAMNLRDLVERYDALSPRERQIMQMVCDGFKGKQIAHKLGISEITVKVHRKNLMDKLGARSIPALVRMADTIAAGARRVQTI